MYNNYNQGQYIPTGDDRFLFAPFILGGIAGTALGYGFASNNNQNNYYPYPVYPSYPVYPTYPTNTNNYYY